MPISPDQFRDRLDSIRARLVGQGRLVTEMTEQVFAAIYERDTATAQALIARDDEVDQADIEIERDAVDLMTSAAHDTCPVESRLIRSIFTGVGPIDFSRALRLLLGQ